MQPPRDESAPARWRALLNRWRRRLWHALFFRIVFGERGSDGRALAFTRISPSTCIEHEEGLVLGDDIFIGHFNVIEARGGVRIDAGVQITSFVSIVSHSSHRSLRLMGHAYSTSGDVAERPGDRKSTRLNSSHERLSRMPSSA